MEAGREEIGAGQEEEESSKSGIKVAEGWGRDSAAWVE
jgi:hypothetical protein